MTNVLVGEAAATHNRNCHNGFFRWGAFFPSCTDSTPPPLSRLHCRFLSSHKHHHLIHIDTRHSSPSRSLLPPSDTGRAVLLTFNTNQARLVSTVLTSGPKYPVTPLFSQGQRPIRYLPFLLPPIPFAISVCLGVEVSSSIH